jgi:hypothetical protein
MDDVLDDVSAAPSVVRVELEGSGSSVPATKTDIVFLC